jgi:hypothetical protein
MKPLIVGKAQKKKHVDHRNKELYPLSEKAVPNVLRNSL